MKYDILVSLGNNCTTSEICRQLQQFTGNSPFDWVVSYSNTAPRVLADLYTFSIDEMVEKFFNLIRVESSMKVYNKEWNLYCPHHIEQSTDSELAPYPHLKYYVSWNNSRDKVTRRFERLLEILKNNSQNVIFLYTNLDMNNDEDVNNLIKTQKLICLFRPENTFKLVFVDINFTEEKKKLMEANNIGYHPIDRVDIENYLILPIVGILMVDYNLNKN